MKKTIKGLIGVLIMVLLYGCSDNNAVEIPSTSIETSTSIQPEELVLSTEPRETDQPEYLSQILNKYGLEYDDIETNQLVVAVADGNIGTLYCYEKSEDGLWKSVIDISEITAWFGINGVTEEPSENIPASPKGLWNLGFAFGNYENPGTELEYRNVTENIYWVDDPDSSSYNRWVEWTSEADWTSAEHLCEISQYAYAVNIEYNYDSPVPGAGSAFFLHCGEAPTSGCIAVVQDNMVNILRWLRPEAKILITTK